MAASSPESTLEIVQLEVGLLQNFCEVIGCPQAREAALVDPAFEVDRLLRVAEERDWTVTTILLTHTHDDHIAGLDEPPLHLLLGHDVLAAFREKLNELSANVDAWESVTKDVNLPPGGPANGGEPGTRDDDAPSDRER